MFIGYTVTGIQNELLEFSIQIIDKMFLIQTIILVSFKVLFL